MSFLEQHHPSLAIPVPIERIVEMGLGLDIIPFPDLKRCRDLDGFLSSDGEAIYVDQAQLEKSLHRYRFTLAHEVSHLLLHLDLYREAAPKTLAEYLAFQESFDGDLRNAYEFQAMNVAGRILLPRAPFVRCAGAVLSGLQARIRETADARTICELLASHVAPRFEVSEEVAFRRLWGDRLCDEIGL